MMPTCSTVSRCRSMAEAQTFGFHSRPHSASSPDPTYLATPDKAQQTHPPAGRMPSRSSGGTSCSGATSRASGAPLMTCAPTASRRYQVSAVPLLRCQQWPCGTRLLSQHEGVRNLSSGTHPAQPLLSARCAVASGLQSTLHCWSVTGWGISGWPCTSMCTGNDRNWSMPCGPAGR